MSINSNANMSQSLVDLINVMKKSIFTENNGVLSPEYFILKLADHCDDFKRLLGNQNNVEKLKNNAEIILKSLKKEKKVADNNELDITASFQKIIQRTLMKKLEQNAVEFDEIDMLITILETSHLPVQEALKKSNITLEEVIKFDNKRNRREAVVEDQGLGSNSTTGVSQLVKSFVVDLTEAAELGKLEPMIGRVEEVERMEQILARRKKNNPIIVGEAGVGKTALVEGLAQKIASGNIHESLQGYRLLSLDVNGMIAGTKFRGDLEDKLKKLIDYIANNKTILFIDEIHTIISSGKSENGTDIGNTLKPYLSSGRIKCVGATTLEEYRKIFEKNAALSRRFNKIDVEELSAEATLHVLKQIKQTYEKGHGVKYTDEALEATVELCHRYLHNKHFPDKAIDVIDETGAFAKLRKEQKIVDVELVETVISKMANQPVKKVEGSEKQVLRKLEESVKSAVFGQDKAVTSVVDSIILAKSGFRPKNKTIGSYLLVGPTGVGKTELAKQLAEKLSMNLIRLDMSEYNERHTVSRLIGSPPGYVGHAEGGQLTEAINKSPYSVLLLDEMEKAAPEVFNIFLQVMDNGFLSDAEGRKTDFRNVIILMTSNAGVKISKQEQNGIGFVKHNAEVKSMINMEVVNKTFAPEFRNRLDAVIEFNSISKDMLDNIVKKNLSHIYETMEKKGFKLVVNQDVLAFLAEKGYNPEMGARPVARVVNEMIALPLAKLVIFDDLKENATVTATMNEGNVEFKVTYPQSEVIKKTRTRKKTESV